MSEEAKKINSQFLNEDVQFVLYDGKNIPFEDAPFDSIFTVNTIYFWKDPQDFLKEIYRVLKPNGKVLITIADKKFMEQLPFTKYIFNLYETDEVEKLDKNVDFQLKEIKENTDEVRSKVGDLVSRKFYTLSLLKVKV